MTATGGTTPYTSWTATGLPPGLSMSSTGLISGTPQLAAAGVGGATSASVAITVIDSASQTASGTLTLAITDPNGPFAITAPAAATFTAAGGVTGQFLATPANAAFNPITWTMTGGDPGITFSAATGSNVTINVAGGVPANTYNLQVTATDTPPCGGPAHTVTVPFTITKNP